MKKEVLTAYEAAILESFGKSKVAFVPELGVTARLTPSEAKAAILGLRSKGFITTSGKGKIATLTQIGEQVAEKVCITVENQIPDRLRHHQQSDSSADDVLARAISAL